MISKRAVQLLALSIFIFGLACVGVFYPYNRYPGLFRHHADRTMLHFIQQAHLHGIARHVADWMCRAALSPQEVRHLLSPRVA